MLKGIEDKVSATRLTGSLCE